MTHNYSQISLFTAICRELERQGKECRPPIKVAVSARQMNAIAEAATSICDAMAIDDIPSTPNIGLRAWLGGHDTGASSLTMAAVIFNAGNYVGNPQRFSHPLDSSDFGRCHRFLEAVPQSREQLHIMADVSPEWKSLVGRWDEITVLYTEAKAAGISAKKANDLIASLT